MGDGGDCLGRYHPGGVVLGKSYLRGNYPGGIRRGKNSLEGNNPGEIVLELGCK